MKRLPGTLIGFLFLFISCNNNLYIADETPGKTNDTLYNATVIKNTMGSGNSFLIKFDKDVYLLPINKTDNVFNAINLPRKFKIQGMRIKVGFREPFNTERIPCKAMGTCYPQIYITKIE